MFELLLLVSSDFEDDIHIIIPVVFVPYLVHF
jgi:hypothetical protein